MFLLVITLNSWLSSGSTEVSIFIHSWNNRFL